MSGTQSIANQSTNQGVEGVCSPQSNDSRICETLSHIRETNIPLPGCQVLGKHGFLRCSHGFQKTVADGHFLKSTPCVPWHARQTAALVGRQPGHKDALEPKVAEQCRHKVKPLSQLLDDEMPLSAMIAIQHGTKLWIFPDGCDPSRADSAYLVELEVGDVLVWRGDLVHAGAGYASDHYRIHAYVYPPSSIYHRPRRLATERCIDPMQPEPKLTGTDDSPSPAAAASSSLPQCKEDLGDAETHAQSKRSPSFMPKDCQQQATGFKVYTFPVKHVEEKAVYPKYGKYNQCARCYALASRDGYTDWYHGDGRARDWKCIKLPDGSNVPASRSGCSVCQVYLCKKCFRMEDEHGNPLPDCWDHRAATRGLMARTVVTE